MVSEPRSSEPGDGTAALGFTESGPTENQVASARTQNDPTPAPVQPRWMTITVALSGIIGLVVMVILVRG